MECRTRTRRRPSRSGTPNDEAARPTKVSCRPASEESTQPSRASLLMFWVEVAESGPGVAGGEVPVDLPLVRVGGVLPGGQFGVEHVQVIDAPVETLPG